MTYLAALVLSGWLTAGQHDSTFDARVAVVHLPMISEKYQRTTDLEAKFDTMRRAFTERRDEMRRRLERLSRSLQEELKPGTDAYIERSREVVLLDGEIKWFIETEGRKLEDGLKTSLGSIFDDIQAMIAEVAGEKGIDVVLAVDRLPETPAENASQLRQQILLQKVLYWHPRLDISETVIRRLNDRYRAANAASQEGSER